MNQSNQPLESFEAFNQYRPLLFSIAYDMLGSVMDAEDMVQETYLRWQGVEQSEVESPKAYLAKIITRLCINQLQSARMQREDYIGPWLPEPIVIEDAANPESAATLADTLSMALLVVLESLSPIERAVYLLRKVFDYDYHEIASMVDKSETACRQIVSRAQRRILEERPKAEAISYEAQQAVTAKFLKAWGSGDIDGLMALLAEDVVLKSDGGGKAFASRKVLVGTEEVLRLLMGLSKLEIPNMKVRFVRVNGQSGIMSEVDGKPFNVMVLDIVNGRIRGIFNIMNPDKLQRVPTIKDINQ